VATLKGRYFTISGRKIPANVSPKYRPIPAPMPASLARGPSPRDRAAQVPVSHANRLAAGIHSSRPSMGIR
jgi:hypothetical protein